eukprot:TRINITY_DN29252_c0_g1_i1.p1 TRINITY_DN29252_c0_g1~~TRINITY_DN29252_c0_g1_i1.p1  ORF type:complete len:272 (+),score=52.20 TRINITY_DN29252_c0_g1_i1:507-1322(+)
MSKASSALSFVSVASSFRSQRWLDVKLTENEYFTRSLGLLLAFISGVLMTAYSSMIKMLKDMDSMQVVVIRGVMQLVIMGAIAKYQKLSFRGTTEVKIAICLFFVAFTGGLRLLFIFTSFSRLPLGDSTTILFSSPVIVMVLSIILFYLGVASSICGSIGLFTFGHPSCPSYDEWLLAITIGFLGLVQQYVLVWAVQLESPARVTIVRQMQIVLAYAVQIVLFGVMPTWTDMLGAGLVLGTVVCITFEKTITEKCDIKRCRGERKSLEGEK